ncbi:MAG: DUF2817 domain-containing protein [Sedimentisphaerales bacterium]|nr:DUF2817 domain-containing protein [Sedimentisphaerales bacterium]
MDKRITIILEACILLAVTCTGCYKPVDYPELGPSQPYLKKPIEQRLAGSSVEERPIMYSVIGRGTEVIFILATIHGDEPAGTPLVNKLENYLRQNLDELLKNRFVVLLPVANPDGLAQKTRHNTNGVDLNRNFATQNRINSKEFGLSPLSEPEAYIIEQLIRQYNPDRIVSIHQPYGCIDYDGPGEKLASHMGKYCDLPVNKLGASPGSLGSFSGETLGIPTITFEMQQNDSNLNAEILWKKYGKALIAAITYPNPVE